jgi:ribonuclease BN (tRNA processing enzyme)
MGGDTVRFIGSGDSFGSGGRFQTCILGEIGGRRFLVDCGASSLVAMRQQGIDPNGIEAIFLTHLHGDHAGGVPFLLIDAMLVSKRTTPLVVAGPPGSAPRMDALREALFPGSAAMSPRFPYAYVELEMGVPNDVAGLRVTPFPALHTPQTTPTMLRIECGGKILTYTGDGDWSDAIATAARDADLLVSECYFYDKPVRMHMNYVTLKAHRGELSAKRVILTHLSEEMLARAGEIDEPCAHDGLVVSI